MSAPPVNRTSQALSGVSCEKSARHSPADCITAPKSGRANSKGSSGTAPADRAASHAPQNERRCPHPHRAGRGAARPRTTCHSACERAASLPGVRRRFQREGQARRLRHEDCKARSITNYERRRGGVYDVAPSPQLRVAPRPPSHLLEHVVRDGGACFSESLAVNPGPTKRLCIISKQADL